MRRTSRALILFAILAALAVLMSVTGASAQTQGGGTVVGTVTINGAGIPTATQPREATTYSFGAINITGVFRNAGGTFAGTIAIPAGVQGGSPSENTVGGMGTVNGFSFTGSGVGTISGTCSGSFNRNLSIVIVNLNCSASINGGAPQGALVTVAAQFTPTQGNGVTTRVTQANFAGAYVSR